MLELFGYVGAFLLTMSAVPQLIKTVRTKKSNDLSIATLLSWSVGCVLMFFYVLETNFSYPLLFNYLFNAIISGLLSIAYFKYKK